MLDGKHGAPMRKLLSWLGFGFLLVAGGIYLAGSAMVDFVGFKDWTKGLGTGAGVVLAILFLIGGVFSELFSTPRNTRKPGE